jgi:hypothetical protein
MTKKKDEFDKFNKRWVIFLVVLVVVCFSSVIWSQVSSTRKDAELTSQCMGVGYQGGYRINGHTFVCIGAAGQLFLFK